MARELPRPAKEVDLHAEDFIHDMDVYEARELLSESIDLLRASLDAAIYWDYTEIRFIHGKGKGILKKQFTKSWPITNRVALLQATTLPTTMRILWSYISVCRPYAWISFCTISKNTLIPRCFTFGFQSKDNVVRCGI